MELVTIGVEETRGRAFLKEHKSVCVWIKGLSVQGSFVVDVLGLDCSGGALHSTMPEKRYQLQ